MNYFSNVYQEFIFNWADNYFLRYIIFLFLFYLFFFGGGGGVENCSIAQTCHVQ